MTAPSDITLTVYREMLGQARGEAPKRLPWIGLTVRQILEEQGLGATGWRVVINGRQIDEARFDEPVAAGAQVSIAPAGGWTAIAQALIMAIISAAVNFAIRKLTPVKKGPQRRDDEASQSYAFSISTDYGPGGPVPMLLGEHDLATRVLSTEIIPDPATGQESMQMVCLLGSGRWDSVGGVLGGVAGETEWIGGPGNWPIYPQNLRINGNVVEPAAAAIALRMGEEEQSPLDIGTPVTTIDVNAPLEDTGQIARATLSGQFINRIAMNVRFPGGLFQTAANGTIQPFFTSGVSGVRFLFEYREQGGAWVRVPNIQQGQAPGIVVIQHPGSDLRQGFTHRVTIWFGYGNGPQSPIEMRLTRESARGGVDQVSQAVCTQASVWSGEPQNYGGWCHMGIRFSGSDTLNGARPQIRVRARGLRVRSWDPVHGFSPYSWSVPPEPFKFHQHPIGNNPAWCLLAFLLHPQGLGEYLTADDIDLQSFRDLADYCDQNVQPFVPRYRCDLVLDQHMPAMDAIELILATCLASLHFRGRKIVVRYSYRDTHGSVPARATWTGTEWIVNHVQVFASSNVEDFRVERTSPRFRPTVIEAHFLNRAIDYTADYVTQEDPKSRGFSLAEPTLNADGIRKEIVRYHGVTRVSQARYMALAQHNVNRLSRKACQFTVGPDALLCEVGDLIAVQSDHVKSLPFGSDSDVDYDEVDYDAFGCRLVEGGSATGIRLDRDVFIPFNQTWSVFLPIQDNNTVRVVERRIQASPLNRSIPAGTLITTFNPLDPTGVNWPIQLIKGAPVAIGPLHRTVTTYEIVEMQVEQDMRVRIRAIEWNPEMFDFDLSAIFREANDLGDEERTSASRVLARGRTVRSPGTDEDTSEPAGGTIPKASDIKVRATAGGQHQVTWVRPSDEIDAGARVYVRAPGTNAWSLAGQASAKSGVTLSGLTPGSLEVAVALSDLLGNFDSVEDAATATVLVDELPRAAVPAVTGFTCYQSGERMVFRWDPIQTGQTVVVRRGDTWFGGEELARGAGSGTDAALAFGGTQQFQARILGASGQWSPTVAALSLDVSYPSGLTAAGASPWTDLSTGAAGTHDNTVWDGVDNRLELDDEAGDVGTYTGAEIDLTTAVRRWWSVSWAQGALDVAATVADMTMPPGSGEAQIRTLEGREPTPADPAFRTRVTVEVRFHDGAGWGAWEPAVPAWRKAQKIQARVRLERASDDYDVWVRDLVVAAATA